MINTPHSKVLTLSRFPRALFLLFAVLLVIPFFDIPLVGLSLTAPLMYVVALAILIRPRWTTWQVYSPWIGWAFSFWFAILLASFMPALFDPKIRITAEDIVWIVRFGYWMIVFVVTILAVSANAWLRRWLPTILGLSILLLAGFRLVELVSLNIGHETFTTSGGVMEQNVYGIQFSTFSAFALHLISRAQGVRRPILILGFALIIFAALTNLSRSSWIAVPISVAVYLALKRTVSQGRLFRFEFWGLFILFLALIIGIASADISLKVVEDRLSTFDLLERDKSFQERQLWIQKGIKLLENYPLFGVGIGRFGDVDISLDIPLVLSKLPDTYFEGRSAHNSYIQLIGETGLLGSTIFGLFILVLLTRGLFAAVSLARAGEEWAIAVYASVVGMSVHFWTLAGLTGTSTWFMYGMLAAVIIRFDQQRVPQRDLTATLPYRASNKSSPA